MVIQPDDPLVSHSLRYQHPHHFVSCCIASRTEDSAAAVGRFTCKGKLPTRFVEFRAPADELLNPIRSLLHQNTHRFTTTQAMSSLHGIGQMDGDIILFTQGHGHPALRKNGIAL